MLDKKKTTIKYLQNELRLAGIEMVFHQNKEGGIDDLTYIDYNTKVVVNCSFLDETYSVKGLLERVSSGLGISPEKRKYQKHRQENGAEDINAKTTPLLWTIEPIERVMHDTARITQKGSGHSKKLRGIFSARQSGNTIGSYGLSDKLYINKRQKITL